MTGTGIGFSQSLPCPGINTRKGRIVFEGNEALVYGLVTEEHQRSLLIVFLRIQKSKGMQCRCTLCNILFTLLFKVQR